MSTVHSLFCESVMVCKVRVNSLCDFGINSESFFRVVGVLLLMVKPRDDQRCENKTSSGIRVQKLMLMANEQKLMNQHKVGG